MAKLSEYDLELTFLSALGVLLAAHYFNFAESFIARAKELEHLQIDELISVALYLMFILPVLLWRRWKRENALRLELSRAVKEAKQLKAFLHMCANCHAIKDETGVWLSTEDYINKHTDTQFTHSVCPECMYKLYPEHADQVYADTETDRVISSTA
ncbi:MAG: hypothetical protein C0624_06245 [Desulfuromonas sp.]|nr:MAG: hypothetical protein C0624_06245 [Desulfuromonas sp.]